jgi:hypothetical protein
MAVLCHAIIEVATPANHDKGRRWLHVMSALRHSSFAGRRVLGVVDWNREDPTHVPDFGHDYRCQCPNPEPWGVDRYFGVSVVLDGPNAKSAETVLELMGPWELFLGARIELSGVTIPEESCEERRKVGP